MADAAIAKLAAAPLLRPWHKYAIRVGVKRLIPFLGTARRLKRAIAPYRTDPDNDASLLGQCLWIIDALNERGVSLAGQDIVEIGTGWNPLLPLLFRVHGAAKVTSVDKRRLTDSRTVRHALAFAAEHGHHVLPQLGLGSDTRELLLRCGVDYRAPFDFCDLPDDSADLIVSRAVLEHIPETVLMRIFRRARDILRPGGVMIHTIDMSDHWEHGDKSISRVNFLRYEENSLWWRFANMHRYQNRLRRYEYLEIIRAAGFRIVSVDGSPNPESLDALRNLPLCRRYCSVPPDELAVIGMAVIAKAEISRPVVEEGGETRGYG